MLPIAAVAKPRRRLPGYRRDVVADRADFRGGPIEANRQPFVLRQLSPAATIGGGKILAPALRPTERLNRCLAVAAGLSDSDPQVRLTAYIDLRGEATFDQTSESWVGLSPARCQKVLGRLVERKDIIRTAESQPRFFTVQRFRQLKQQLVRRCQIELERRRPASQVPLSIILSAMSRHASQPVLGVLLEEMTAQHELVRRGDRVGLPTGPELSHRQRGMLNMLLAECVGAGPAPPTLKEFAERNGYPLRDLETLAQVAIDEGRLVRLSPQMVIDRANEVLAQASNPR